MISCVDLKAAYPDHLLNIVADVFGGGRFILGDKIAGFEDAWATYCGAQYAVGCGSGFDALRLLLLASDIGPGDEVLVSAWTCPPTWLAVQSVGACVVPIDAEPDTMLLDISCIRERVTPRSRAIIPVHLYGNLADMERVTYAASKHNLIVIEDACQAHGATFMGALAGVWGAGAAYSFYPTKNLGAYGDGGAVVTNDMAVARKVRELRNYGATGAINSRLDELQAAFLLAKLPTLSNANTYRALTAQRYTHGLRNCPGVTLPRAGLECRPNWHQYVIRHERRDDLRAYLKAHGVETLIHYPTPPHRLLRCDGCGLPVTDELARTVLSLPMGLHVGEQDVEMVVKLIWAFADPVHTPAVCDGTERACQCAC